MPNILINISNHNSSTWAPEMADVAVFYWDRIIDVPFPAVPAHYSGKEVEQMAKGLYVSLPHIVDSEVKESARNVSVMVQGEQSLVYYLIAMLKASGITVVQACSERNTVVHHDGSKTVKFEFKQFREL